ncbi:MAG: EamA family transporter [Bacteroidales bacterium]|nr:EamA family transporter [Bacteroidales bacterium]
MWIWLILASAVFLGAYDVAKKKAIEKNNIWYILFGATALSALFLSPFLTHGSASEHGALIFKATLVCTSWVCGMVALRLLPITIVSPFKASRPMFVVIFSLLLFGERLSPLQWVGVAVILAALFLLGRTGGREGISFLRNRGVWALFASILTGVASALFDKHILSGMGMAPLFVQSWTNVYISALLAVVILARALASGHGSPAFERFRFDWCILLVAVLITAADMLYFFALKQDGAMLSVVSLLRRSSAIVTFALGAVVFKEHRICEKTIILAILLGGVVLLALSS